MGTARSSKMLLTKTMQAVVGWPRFNSQVKPGQKPPNMLQKRGPHMAQPGRTCSQRSWRHFTSPVPHGRLVCHCLQVTAIVLHTRVCLFIMLHMFWALPQAEDSGPDPTNMNPSHWRPG